MFNCNYVQDEVSKEISDDAPLEFPVAGSERTSTPIKPTVWSRTSLIHAYVLIVLLLTQSYYTAHSKIC